MNNFSYLLNFSESITIGEDVTRLYQYDIGLNDGNIGWIRIRYNKNKNEAVATLRVRYLDSYTASGTAKNMLEDLMRKVITNESASHTFSMINHTESSRFKVEHYYLTNMFSTGGLVIACCLCLFIYNFLNNIFAMTVFIVITTAMQLLSTYFTTKSNSIILKKNKVAIAK